MTRDYARDLGVQLPDVDDLAGVFGPDVGGDRDVVAVLGDRVVLDKPREVVGVSARRERVEDLLPVCLGELVLVPWRLDEGRRRLPPFDRSQDEAPGVRPRGSRHLPGLLPDLGCGYAVGVPGTTRARSRPRQLTVPRLF